MLDINSSYKAGVVSNYNIVAELNGKAIVEQDKDIEIERLKTTCFDLNNKSAVVDDLRKDNDILTRRLNESETERQRQEEMIKQLQNDVSAQKRENSSLKSDMSNLMTAKSTM
jgi:septal ring factor EnvC (AmiA/AmiB activator)